MNQTGGADRRGPAPSGTRGKLKSEEWCGKPCKGFTVRCFWVAARDWRRRVHRQTEGGFVNSCRKGSQLWTRQPWPPFSPAPDCAPLRVRQPHFRWPPSGQFDGIVRTRRTANGPARTTAPASSAGTAPVKIVRRFDQPATRSGSSAPGTREPLRDQVVAGVHSIDRHGGQRPPIGIGPLPLDHDPAPRQQPDKSDARGFAGGKITPGVGPAPVLALRTVGKFGRVNIGDAHPLAAATDRVAVVDRG